jgi:hypothetical protein
MAKRQTTREVRAVGSAVGGKKEGAKLIEAAMAEAVRLCYATGITDPARVRAAQLEARARIKAELDGTPASPATKA